MGESLPFFGFRHPDQDYLYQDELQELEKMGVVRVLAAPSRAPGLPKTYVQGRTLEQHADMCLDWSEVMVGQERDFIGLKARWFMWLDVPKEIRTHESVAYKAITGKRDTQFGVNAGSPVSLLDDPDGNTYCMKSVSLITDPNQTYGSPADLGGRLKLPPGWRFRTQMLEQDLVLTPDTGAVIITQDEWGNTYDRVGGAYSNYEP